MTKRARRFRDHDRRGLRGGLWLLLICTIAYLPGTFTIPPVDRDESRFAQASRQVMEAAQDGDLEGVLVPRIQDEPRLNKPPLIYWAQAASAWFFDRNEEGADPRLQRIGWYRLPSVLFAMIAVFATWRTGCLIYRRDEGFIAAVMLALCPMVLWDAHQARADQLLLACTTLALWALASIWKTQRDGGRVSMGQSLALWACVGLGVMAKGPITPMVVVLALGVLWWCGAGWRCVRATRPLLGIAIVLAMVLPWVIGVASVVGWGEYASIVFDETLGRAGSAKESHWGPPGYHLVLLPALFFPGSLVTLLALRRAYRRVRRRKSWHWRAPEALLLAWVIPAWIVFELVMTKLPHYTLVLYPALALLSARGLVVFVRAGRRIDRPGIVLWGAIGLAIALAPVGIWFVFGDAPFDAPVGAVFLSCAFAVLFLIWGVLSAWRNNLRRATMEGAMAMLAIALGLFAFLLPSLTEPWPSSTIAQGIAEVDPNGELPLARTGYHEDSLVFLTRGRAERVSRQRLEAWLSMNPGGLVVYQRARDTALPAGAVVLGDVEGFNYSKGDHVHLLLLRSRPASSARIPQPQAPPPESGPTP